MKSVYEDAYDRLIKKYGVAADGISRENEITIRCDCFSSTTAYGKTMIEKVIFNDPATIVFWNDGTKTVVKCQEGDTFDKEKGLAMAITKKYLGNKGSYYNVIKKWTEN